MAATNDEPAPGADKRSIPTAEDGNDPQFPVVGIGASAGGLEALTEFFQEMSADTGMAFVVVSHLDPEHISALSEILGRISPMPVRDAVEDQPIEPNRVYVIPPNKELTISRGKLHLAARPETRMPHLPVDAFLRSLALDRRGQAIGVVLSGTGADGMVGLKAIKEAGGLTFAQDISARYSGMPQSAIAAGCVDAVLPPARIAFELARMAPQLAQVRAEDGAAPRELEESDAFLQILRLLTASSGVDFVHYKHSTLRRRIERRMVLRQLPTLQDYLRMLREDAAEQATLFEEMLIPVTRFFRDPEVFEALKATVFPRLTANRFDRAPIRVWVPGCATGEEAYSIAICLLEHLATAGVSIPIKVFGTDISERAVEAARTGAYSEGIAGEVSAQRLLRYFQKTDQGYEIAKTVRDLCVFARQDVTKDPPFSQLDLISCRNVLIYLGSGLQNRVFPIFHYALKPGGFLLLGSAETVGQFADLFEQVDKSHRIYARTQAPTRLTFDYKLGAPSRTRVAIHEKATVVGNDLQDLYREADRVVLRQYSPPGIVVDENLHVVQFRGDTGRFLKPPPGPPVSELLLMAREGLLGDLREIIARAKQENATVRKPGVRVKTNDHFQEIDLTVTPITHVATGTRHFVVLFEDAQLLAGAAAFAAPEPPNPKMESEKDRDLDRVKHELESTRAYLQSVIELKDVSNEELRAANEEVISSNEELQSTNEELTTAKEELQATNEELSTVNDELQNRIRVANQLADDLVNLIENTNIPIVVLGADLCIRRFTPGAQRVFNLRPTDLGRPIGDLKLKINVPDLELLVHEVIDTLEIRQREITDDSGAWHKMYIRPYKTLNHVIGGAVLMLIDIDALKSRERQIQESRDYAVNIVETVREPLIVLDGRLRVRTANRAFYRVFGASPSQTEGRLIYELDEGQWNIPTLRKLLEEILPRNEHFENYEVDYECRRIGQRTMLLNAHRVVRPQEDPEQLILLAIEDVTARKQAEDEARRLAAIVESSDDAIVGRNLDDVIVSWNAAAERILGYPAPEAVGKPYSMLIPAESADESRKLAPRIQRGERIVSFRTKWIRADGRPITVAVTHSPIKDSEGRIVGASAIVRDVNEQEKTEKALTVSEERFRTLVGSAVDSIITIDEAGTIDSVNPAAEKMFGYSAAELIGHNIKMLMPSPFREEHDRYLERYFRTGEKRIIDIGREVRGRHKDGSTFPVDLVVSEFRDRARRMFTGAVRDISARKRLEREVLEIATLEQRRIGQALHDSTGQELTALGLLAETLAENLQKQNAAAAPLAAKITERLHGVLAQVRAYSRGLIPVEVDSRGLRAALAELATRTSELHKIACTFDCQGPVDVEDNQTATQLFHIAQEAVTNSLRHAQARHIAIRLAGDDKALTLRVSDDGVGIPDRQFDAEGMGLKIMRYRAGLIQCGLSIERAQPVGTAVVCTLSKEKNRPTIAGEPPAARDSGPSSGTNAT